jgi:hypothetical protein
MFIYFLNREYGRRTLGEEIIELILEIFFYLKLSLFFNILTTFSLFSICTVYIYKEWFLTPNKIAMGVKVLVRY